MSGPARKHWYRILVARDGEQCFIGGEAGCPDTLIIDHWSGVDTDNRSQNLHLLCRQMNATKNPRGRAISRRTPEEDELLSCMHVRRIDTEDTVMASIRKAQSSEFAKNLHCEANFRHWLFYCLVRLPAFDLDKVVTNGAFLVGCSDDTIKRYVKRLTCLAGMYQLEASAETGAQLIRLKPKWESFRKRNEQNARLNAQARNWKESDIERTAMGRIVRIEPHERQANAPK